MNPDPDTNTAMMLGEMRAQLRELVHQGNNQVQKNDAVARTIAQLESIPKDIAEIKDRLTTLETDRTRRDSERSTIATIMRSPVVGWLVGAATAGWALLTGETDAVTRKEAFAALAKLLPGIWNKPGTIKEMDELMAAAGVKPDAPSEPVTHSLSDAAAFYGLVRGITGPLDQAQVDSVTEILRAVAHWPLAWVAYALATAWHESRLLPIKEMGGDAYLSKYDTGWLAKILGNTPERDGDGIKYAGRGFVQLTGKANYRKAGAALGIDLLAQPNLALNPAHAARILAWGMSTGAFTGKALRHYITDPRGTEGQFQSARRIINGTDRATLIAGHAMRFQNALDTGGWK